VSAIPAPSPTYSETLALEGRMVQGALENFFAKTGISHPQCLPEQPLDALLRTLRPVPLHHYLQGVPLVQVPLARLTAGKAISWLGLVYGWREAIPPGDSVDSPLAALMVLSRGPGGFLFVNADDPIPRQRFSLAHELGHFLLHADQIRAELAQGRILALEHNPQNQEKDPDYEARERQANRFAAELLMPEKIIRAVFRHAFPNGVDPKTSKHHIGPVHRVGWVLAQKLLVSHEAMHFRFPSLNLVPFVYGRKRPEIWP